MIFQESESVALKAIVVEDIKKRLSHLQTVREEKYILVFRMTEPYQGWIIRTKLLYKSAIWSGMQSSRI